MGRMNMSAAAASSSSNKYTLDLSTATLVDTGSMQGGSTSLGTSSTIGAAAGQHGQWDAGMDGYALLAALPVVPTQGQTLRLVMTCSGVTGDPGLGSAAVSMMLSPTASPVSAQGYYTAGFKQTSTSATQSLNPDRFGDQIGGNTALGGSLTTVAEFLWDGGPKACNTITFGGTSGVVYKGNTQGNAGTWSAPYVGLGMQNQSTNLSDGAVEVVWADVVITVEVIL